MAGSRASPGEGEEGFRPVPLAGFLAEAPAPVDEQLAIVGQDDAEALERAGREVLRQTAMEAVLVTRGSRGMALFQPGHPTVHIPIFGSDEVTDVTGAGDTVIAVMTLALAAGASFVDAAQLATYGAGVVVTKRGTASVDPDELRVAAGQGPAIARYPTQQAPNTVQTTAGLAVKGSGPGWSATGGYPARGTAVAAERGMPATNSGIIEPEEAAS